jgi:predicted Zn-dependent peptidase
MAHFLEHLVFKGGEKFDDYRKVNETAERMGGSLNAYTSHDLVAFHITVRAESTMEALDLLTDFVGRPKIDQAELDKERGVVIQEIARYKDQPSAVAEELIDRAAFGDHPLGRTVLGPKEHLETFSRDAIVAFRERAGRARAAARSSSATRSTRATTPRSASCSAASRRSTSPAPTSPRPSCTRGSWSSSATPTSRTCG